MSRDLGIEVVIQLWTDSRAGKAIASRKGIVRVRHLDVSELWVQDSIRSGLLNVNKVLGTENPADILTKYVEAALIEKHMHKLMVHPREGRSSLAPQITSVAHAIADRAVRGGVLGCERRSALAAPCCACPLRASAAFRRNRLAMH